MAKRRGSRKSGVLRTTKRVAQKTVGFLEKGLSGLFGVVKEGVQMGVKDVKKGVKMVSSRRKHRKSKRRSTRRKH
jgi:hypothetical protein